MSCTSVQNLISQYLDGRLNDAEAELVEEHVHACTRCERDFQNSRYLSRLLKENLDLPEPPEDLPSAVIRTVERMRAGRGAGGR